jgi:hypothetical protein
VTFLEATTKAPAALDEYELYVVDGVFVLARLPRSTRPAELHLTLSGWRRRRPVASWDGCAFVV